MLAFSKAQLFEAVFASIDNLAEGTTLVDNPCSIDLGRLRLGKLSTSEEEDPPSCPPNCDALSLRVTALEKLVASKPTPAAREVRFLWRTDDGGAYGAIRANLRHVV